ncbi:MAG: rubredoxin [Endomicrobium sp.]|jgi:rubredoxin|nr:rubredoxin [Endomicrobium sp.]
MEKWICMACGYTYDSQFGIPESGIAAQTKFEQLPNDWVCPICGASKNAFEKVENE